jgi:hypothetical protein
MRVKIYLGLVVGVFPRVLPYVLVILFLLFFIDWPGYYSPRHLKALWNLGHIVFFALLPYTVFSRFKWHWESFGRQCLLTMAMCIVLGSIIEMGQYGLKLDVDLGDVFRDLIGGWVGLFFLFPSRKRVQKKSMRVLQIITVCLVGLQIYPVFVAFTDEFIARKQFPVLSGFETPWEIQRWTGGAAFAVDDKIHHGGKHSLRVLLKTDMYSGVSLFYFPENWEGAKSFQFSICNPSEEILSITCRIHDQEHNQGSKLYTDRFNRKFSLTKGWNTIVIDMQDIRNAPEGREMDIRRIRGVGVFATMLKQCRVVYLDDVGLQY